MRTRHLLTATALTLALVTLAQRASANTLELALVIDGSGSIVPGDWALQTGAYQSIFQNDFYTNFIQPSPYDDIAVAAYVFSGGTIVDSNTQQPLQTFAVSWYLDWTTIGNDQQAATFGALLGAIPQPTGQTNTSAALDIATHGGTVGCLIAQICNLNPDGTATGLLNNGIDGSKLVIDISTDGVPTLPNANGDPNQEPEASMDRALAIAAADAARAAGITVNAIGVGSGVDSAFLRSLVGIDPASTPTGFFLTASSFSQFDEALLEKVGRETAVPIAPALPLALTAFGSTLFWRRKAATRR